MKQVASLTGLIEFHTQHILTYRAHHQREQSRDKAC
jgi:uncharacterized protein YbgA (DUF1722 family)